MTVPGRAPPFSFLAPWLPGGTNSFASSQTVPVNAGHFKQHQATQLFQAGCSLSTYSFWYLNCSKAYERELGNHVACSYMLSWSGTRFIWSQHCHVFRSIQLQRSKALAGPEVHIPPGGGFPLISWLDGHCQIIGVKNSISQDAWMNELTIYEPLANPSPLLNHPIKNHVFITNSD